MRYQLFRRGLRNKRMLATLDASPASDIPEACEGLMFTGIRRPNEEDDEFSDAETTKKKESDSPAFASVDALALQLKTFMEQQTLWQQQLAQRQWQSSRSPCSGSCCYAGVELYRRWSQPAASDSTVPRDPYE
ncbi:unnamed protein product [Phytophthora fragariaefolia]|uniref:Unnamed protein product n=1 Tax=Phytophthora fragariaefolia TaxID=1490495 RepID=A0A9W7CUH3_9STRA|nr:unnamed protein product [Phytophthora fragariaefolia]